MEKNIAHPTDARLYERARRKLVGLAREAGIRLRQNYNRLGPRLCGQVGRYAHARQFKRMRKALRRLKGYTGRVARDIERQMDKVAEGPLKTRLQALVALTNRLLAQKLKDHQKLYSLHEPAVDCISKGKAHKRYEFGTKVSVATTTEGGFVVGMRALPGNPYDGHTLHEALEQVEILTDRRPDMAFVDRGYRGHGVEIVKVFISGARRGVTRTIAKLLRRRSAIEPMIGHMKTDGRLTRCPLKGTTGDALFAVLCGCGHNIRMILRHLRAFLCQFIWLITMIRKIERSAGHHQKLQTAA
jgi:IS5 family transposase